MKGEKSTFPLSFPVLNVFLVSKAKKRWSPSRSLEREKTTFDAEREKNDFLKWKPFVFALNDVDRRTTIPRGDKVPLAKNNWLLIN